MNPLRPRGLLIGSLAACLAILAPLFSAAPAGAAGPAHAVPAGAVAITRQDAYRFQGWGTTLAWWANVVGGWSAANRQSIEDQLFGEPDAAHPDRLGLNVVRYNVGASSTTGNPPVATGMPACLPFGAGKAVPTPVPGPGQPVDLGLDANQVLVLDEARQRIGRHAVLEAFANSPPWWMTETGCPQGSRTPFGDNLSPTRDGEYADYLAQVLDAFRARGVAFDSVEALNEPEAPWGALPCSSGCQEGDHFDPFGHQSQVLTQLCAQLRAHGLPTRIAAPDSFNPDLTIAVTGLFDQAARDCVARFGTHMYGLTPTNDLVPYQGASRRALADLAAAQSKPLWMSEFGTGGSSADLGSALTYSREIAKDLRYLRPRAWVNWQAVEASGGWGLFEAPRWPAETGAPGGGRPVTETRRFSAMEQYSRFIRPGFTMLTALDPQDDPVHETTPTLAAVDDLRSPRKIVIVGTTAQDREVAYDLAPLGVAGLAGKARLTRYRTSASGNVQRLDATPVPLRADNFSDAQPANSITTYVIDFPPGRHGTGPPPFEPTTTRVASSANPAVAGQPVTFTATVAGGEDDGPAPTGTVTFTLGSKVLGTAALDQAGHASLTVSDVPAGTSEVRATYGGDRRFLPTSGGVAQVVTSAP